MVNIVITGKNLCVVPVIESVTEPLMVLVHVSCFTNLLGTTKTNTAQYA